jgi:hypothetical protein
MSRRLLLTAAVCLLAFGAQAQHQTVQFHAVLDGAHEVPSNKTGGTGRLDAVLGRLPVGR